MKEKEANDRVIIRVSPLVTQEDTEIKEGSSSSDSYEDLSHYEDEDAATLRSLKQRLTSWHPATGRFRMNAIVPN